MKQGPIGIFDSGVGGLTVVKEIFRLLPNEEVVYLGDTARVPYGTKSSETIQRFCIENVEFLAKFNVKLIVVACNTASSISLPILRKRFNIPLLGVIKPGAGQAVNITKNGRIGVIGTYATIKSNAYKKEIKKISRDIEVISQACPMFVPLVEEGWIKEKVTFDIAKKYLMPLMQKHIDTLILGCTHYPLLKSVISKVMGDGVKIVDSASSVAENVKDVLAAEGTFVGYRRLPTKVPVPVHRFFATDAVEHFVRIGEKFLGSKISNAERANYV